MITAEDAGNLLKLIDRALKGGPQQGGVNDHMATAALIVKLSKIAKGEPDGEDVSPTD